MATSTLRSWAGNVQWRPKAVHHPRSEEEITALIERVAGAGERLKAVGSGLSWSDINEVEGQHLLLSDRMTAIHADPDHHRVRVQGGALMSSINRALAAAGLAFDNFGSIVTQTAAGYIGTGTHGSGPPLLSTRIVAMRLVDGRGRLRILTADSEPELLSAARVHLGCLGVVTEITFECEDAFDLEERREVLPFDRVLADLDGHLSNNDYLKLWWLPYADHIQVYAYNRTTARRTTPRLTELMDERGISTWSFTALLALSRALPPVTPTMNRTLQRFYFTPRRRVNRSDRLFNITRMIPIHNEAEYAIPRSRAAEAIEEVAKMVRAAPPAYYVNFPQEIRFVPADDIPMSPATGRDSCYIGAYVAGARWTAAYHRAFEELMRDYEGRPHWGKLFHRTAADFAALYPAYGSFDRLRRECDPAGVFHNAFTDRVFGA